MVKIDYVEIKKGLEEDFDQVLNMFESENSTAKDLVQYIKNHSRLKFLFERYDYCEHYDKPYQGLFETTEAIEAKYSSDFKAIRDFKERKEKKQYEKNQLIHECKQRLQAHYLEGAYIECEEDKDILAFSHRRVGWSAPKYPLNDKFSIQLKTNFGYGSVSYFYTKIRYKDLDIVPFSDWVNYKFSRIYEITQYSSKHRLRNESWKEAMEYVAEACNIAMTNEKLFVQRYIVDQCDEMVAGLKNILTNNKLQFKEYRFLNQERGYIDLDLDEHNLTEFRGEKISGALGFITPIRKFSHVVEIEKYIEEIESCNLEVKPLIIEEQGNVEKNLKMLRIEKDVLETQYKKQKEKEQIFLQKRASLKKDIYAETGTYDEVKLDYEFNRQNPDYEDFKKELNDVTKEYHQKIEAINRNEKTLENLIKYENDINEYFNKKGREDDKSPHMK